MSAAHLCVDRSHTRMNIWLWLTVPGANITRQYGSLLFIVVFVLPEYESISRDNR